LPHARPEDWVPRVVRETGGTNGTTKIRMVACAAALFLWAAPTLAADKTYQVTGPVLDVGADSITVKKDTESWQIARDAGTKVTGDPKKGDKVTVYYRMTATEIEAKPAPAVKKK